MFSQRKRTNRKVVLSVAESHSRRLRLTAVTLDIFFSPMGTYGFGYHYFAKVLPALLPAGSG